MVAYLITFANFLIKAVGDGLGAILGLLSFSPYRAVIQLLESNAESHSMLFSFINWVIPIAEIVALLSAWGLAIGIWYLLSIALRWFKAVQ
jgi:hypothetical protein